MPIILRQDRSITLALAISLQAASLIGSSMPSAAEDASLCADENGQPLGYKPGLGGCDCPAGYTRSYLETVHQGRWTALHYICIHPKVAAPPPPQTLDVSPPSADTNVSDETPTEPTPPQTNPPDDDSPPAVETPRSPPTSKPPIGPVVQAVGLAAIAVGLALIAAPLLVPALVGGVVGAAACAAVGVGLAFSGGWAATQSMQADTDRITTAVEHAVPDTSP